MTTIKILLSVAFALLIAMIASSFALMCFCKRKFTKVIPPIALALHILLFAVAMMLSLTIDYLLLLVLSLLALYVILYFVSYKIQQGKKNKEFPPEENEAKEKNV